MDCDRFWGKKLDLVVVEVREEVRGKPLNLLGGLEIQGFEDGKLKNKKEKKKKEEVRKSEQARDGEVFMDEGFFGF